MRFGVYLETNFIFKNGQLLCQDVYSKFLDLLASNFKIKFNYLIKNTDNNITSFNKIIMFDEVYTLKSYKNLISLIPFYIFYLPFVIKGINKFIDEVDCVIIMCPSPISKTIFKIAKRKNKKIILLFRQDIVEMTSNRFEGFKKIFAIFFANYYQNYFYKNIDFNTKIVTSGEKLRQIFLEYSNNVFSVADSRFFDRDVRKVNDIGDIDFNSRLKFLFVGRLEVNKGIKELLSTSLFFKDNIRLTIVGDGPMRSEIDDFILVNDLYDSIDCKGFISYGEELLKIYSQNDFFLFPSYSEGLPQVILEAMVNGCVVISTNVGSIPYIIDDKFNGILVNPNDLDGLLSSIKLLFNSSHNLREIRINAINTAKKYSFENQIKLFEKILNE